MKKLMFILTIVSIVVTTFVSRWTDMTYAPSIVKSLSILVINVIPFALLWYLFFRNSYTKRVLATGSCIALFGAVSNTLVQVVNNGYFPVEPKLYYSGNKIMNYLYISGGNLSFLGDLEVLNAASIGDIALFAGLIVILICCIIEPVIYFRRIKRNEMVVC